MKIGPDLEVRIVELTDLQEQPINAQTMSQQTFDRLTENIRERGALESLPFVHEADGKLSIVSGHHRYRAAHAAGLTEIPVIVDTSDMPRSKVVAKQLAHNYLVGHSDDSIVREMLKEVKHADDLLATGAPDYLLPIPDMDPPLLGSPHADFDWRVVSFTFLPHQLDSFKELVATLDGTQDLVGVGNVECFEAFAKAVSGYSRIKEIRSVGTTLHVLTQIAAQRIAMKEGSEEDAWVRVEAVIGTDSVPASAGNVIVEALKKAIARGDVSQNAPWQFLELLCAEYLAGPA